MNANTNVNSNVQTQNTNQTAQYQLFTRKDGVFSGYFNLEWARKNALNPALAILLQECPETVYELEFSKICPCPDLRFVEPGSLDIRYPHDSGVENLVIFFDPEDTGFKCLEIYNEGFKAPPTSTFWGKDVETVKKFVLGNLKRGFLKDLRLFSGLLKEEMQLSLGRELPEEYEEDYLYFCMRYGILVYDLKAKVFRFNKYEELSSSS